VAHLRAAVLAVLLLTGTPAAPALAAGGTPARPVAAAHVSGHVAAQAGPVVPQPGSGWLTGRRQRLLFVWVLTDLGLVLLLLAGQPVRRPRLLGSLGRRQPQPEDGPEPVIGGVGRFARPRTEPPARL